MIGNTWSIAQRSGNDWNKEKLQKYLSGNIFEIFFNSSGNASLETAGSGDVLTGLMAGFMAQGYAPEIASLIAIYVHGIAGEISSETHGILGVKAGDIADNVGKAIKQILTI